MKYARFLLTLCSLICIWSATASAADIYVNRFWHSTNIRPITDITLMIR